VPSGVRHIEFQLACARVNVHARNIAV
jgi:hypothetical protein